MKSICFILILLPLISLSQTYQNEEAKINTGIGSGAAVVGEKQGLNLSETGRLSGVNRNKATEKIESINLKKELSAKNIRLHPNQKYKVKSGEQFVIFFEDLEVSDASILITSFDEGHQINHIVKTKREGDFKIFLNFAIIEVSKGKTIKSNGFQMIGESIVLTSGMSFKVSKEINCLYLRGES